MLGVAIYCDGAAVGGAVDVLTLRCLSDVEFELEKSLEVYGAFSRGGFQRPPGEIITARELM